MMDDKIREEICKRWRSLGFTEGLSGSNIEKVAKLFESEAKELPRTADPDEKLVLPIMRQMPVKK